MPQAIELILASSSPRRRQLLAEHGYRFRVVPPHPNAECGACSGETAPALVARLARQKAADVVRRAGSGLVIGCDTVAECGGQILGKPADEAHARQILQSLSGREHRVYSGLCLWPAPDGQPQIAVEVTRLRMQSLDESQLDEYLASGLWEGKAGAFGYQDRLGWLTILEGSESNVVGMPMELLERMLAAYA
jgi:septum formation protein